MTACATPLVRRDAPIISPFFPNFWGQRVHKAVCPPRLPRYAVIGQHNASFLGGVVGGDEASGNGFFSRRCRHIIATPQLGT